MSLRLLAGFTSGFLSQQPPALVEEPPKVSSEKKIAMVSIPDVVLSAIEINVNTLCQKILKETAKHEITDCLRECFELGRSLHTQESYSTWARTLSLIKQITDSMDRVKIQDHLLRQRQIEKVLNVSLSILKAQMATCISQLHLKDQYVFVSQSELGENNFQLLPCHLLFFKGDYQFVPAPRGMIELEPESANPIPDTDIQYPSNAKTLADYENRLKKYTTEKDNISLDPTLNMFSSPFLPSDVILEVSGHKVTVLECIWIDIFRLHSFNIQDDIIYDQISLDNEYKRIEKSVADTLKKDREAHVDLLKKDHQTELMGVIYRILFNLTNNMQLVERMLLLCTQTVQTRLLTKLHQKFANPSLNICVQTGKVDVKISTVNSNGTLFFAIEHRTIYQIVMLEKVASLEGERKENAEKIERSSNDSPYETVGCIIGTRHYLIKASTGVLASVEDTSSLTFKPKKKKVNQQQVIIE